MPNEVSLDLFFVWRIPFYDLLLDLFRPLVCGREQVVGVCAVGVVGVDCGISLVGGRGALQRSAHHQAILSLPFVVW
jgi:hypothetical protein